MTIDLTDNAPRISYTVSSSQLSFSVPFEFFDDADLVVVVNGTTKTLTTHYTVSGGNGSTGSITMTSGNAVTSGTVIIFRNIAFKRTTDFPTSGGFPIATLNTELDRNMALFDDQQDHINRAIRLNDADDSVSMELPLKASRKGTVLGFNATTGAVEAGPTIANVNSLADITTNINTVAGIASNVTTVAGIDTNVSTVAGISSNVSTVAGIQSNVSSVAGNATNINTVAGSIANINTVATNIADVNAVAADLAETVSEIETVALDLQETQSEIDTVATNITNVNTVGNAITNVNTTATNIGNINTLAGISSNVSTVAGIDSDVTAVANISSNVTAVAGDATDIGTVATNIANVNTVGGISGNVTTVAGISGNVSTVAGISSNVSTVAGIDTDVSTVAGISSNVTSVANDASDIGAVASAISNVNTVAGNTTNINTVAGNNSNISTVGGISSNVTTVAGIASDVTTVAGLSSTISAVNSNSSNINAVNSNSSNINTVAGNTSNINTVAGISSNVTTVANDATDIGTVSTNISNVNTLANALSGTNAYTVTVVNSGGNKFALNGATNPTLTLKRGITYTFDQSDNSNSGHPLAFKDGSGNAYTSGVTVTGSAGQAGAKVVFAVPSNAPSSLLYYCTVHGNAMGNSITVQDDNVAIVAGISSDITSVAGVASNVTTVAGIASNVTTVASNVSGINDFADRYRVASSAPSSNNDEGDLYYNTTSDQLFVYNGSAWISAALDASSALVPSNNLSDVASASTARTNLGLGDAATKTVGISNGNVPTFTSGVADNDFLKINGTTVEGRSASEVLSDIGGQASLTFGISSGNVPTFASGVADNDFLKIDGTTVEGRSAAEVRSDLNIEDGATANSAGNAITISNGVINHSDTSSQASSNNSGRTYIQDITLDTYGHVTGIATATETVTDTNTTYSGGTNISLSGTTFNLDNSINLSGTVQATRYYIDGTTRFIDSNSGGYGSIRVEGGTYAGYGIRDDWVFMSNGPDLSGIYNDTDDEWAAIFRRNAEVELFHNGSVKLETTSSGVSITGDAVVSSTTKSASVVAGSISLSPSSPGALAICGSTDPYISFHDAGSSLRDGYFQKIHSGDYFYFGEVSYTSSVGSFRAPIFYDTNNTSYYCNPSDTSKLYNINIINQLQVNGATGNSGQVLTSNGSSAPTWQDAGGGAWEVIGNYTGTATGTNATVDFVHGQGGFVHDATTYKHHKMYAVLWNTNGATSNNYISIYPLVGTTSSYAPMTSLVARHQNWNLIHPEFTTVTYNQNKWGYGVQSFANNTGAVIQSMRLYRSATTYNAVGLGAFSESISGTTRSSGDRFFPTVLELDFPSKGIDSGFGMSGKAYYKFDQGLFDNFTYRVRWMMMGIGYGKVGWRIYSGTTNANFNYDITWIGLKP